MRLPGSKLRFKMPPRPPVTPEQLRRRADVIESQMCTGIAASWCPVHGDCTCPRDEHGEPRQRFWDIPASLDDPNCPLHAPSSSHAVAEMLRRVRSVGAL